MVGEFEHTQGQGALGENDAQSEVAKETSEPEKWEKIKGRIFSQWAKLPPEERASVMLSQLRYTLRIKQRGEGETYDAYVRYVNELLPPDLHDMLP